MVVETLPVVGQTPAEGVPVHVAIIMDGNGRWARARGRSRNAGHRAGTENIRRVIRAFAERGVRYLTLYAFSTENWRRPRTEVQALMRLMARVIAREVAALHENNVRLVHVGELAALPSHLQQKVRHAIELTRNNTGITVAVAFNYGGRAEIVEAVRRIVADGRRPEEVSEELISSLLYTSGMPDPDLVIRTAGEMRLSNFLIWQAAYAEYYATETCWPDFDPIEIDRALQAFAHRRRKFGAVPGEEAG